MLQQSARATVVASTILLLFFAQSCGTTASIAVQDLIAADEDLMKASPLTVAQCRAGCLHKVSVVLNSIQLCCKNSRIRYLAGIKIGQL